MEWQARWMRAYYGDDDVQGHAFTVYAPGLMGAFNLARVQHPTATRWECLGLVDPNDPERVKR